VVNIEFRVERHPHYGTTVIVTGTIINAGTVDFSSTANQQALQLWEVPAGRSGYHVRSATFQVLRRGANLRVVYRIPATEFLRRFPSRAPSYLLLIAYDPDIRNDGRPQNDDCGYTDNRLVRDASSVYGLIRG